MKNGRKNLKAVVIFSRIFPKTHFAFFAIFDFFLVSYDGVKSNFFAFNLIWGIYGNCGHEFGCVDFYFDKRDQGLNTATRFQGRTALPLVQSC